MCVLTSNVCRLFVCFWKVEDGGSLREPRARHHAAAAAARHHRQNQRAGASLRDPVLPRSDSRLTGADAALALIGRVLELIVVAAVTQIY